MISEKKKFKFGFMIYFLWGYHGIKKNLSIKLVHDFASDYFISYS